MIFQGQDYTHNQMRELREDDNNPIAPLVDWLNTSKVGEYTNYYTYRVFHTPKGFFACYADNTENYWGV